jgi:hypothetical protein
LSIDAEKFVWELIPESFPTDFPGEFPSELSAIHTLQVARKALARELRNKRRREKHKAN